MVLLNHIAMLMHALFEVIFWMVLFILFQIFVCFVFGSPQPCSVMFGHVRMVLLNHMAMLSCALRSCSDGPPQPYSYAVAYSV